MIIYECGLKIIITISGLPAMITGVNIRFDDVTYEATYYYDGEHRTVWLREQEFTTEEIKKIGYKTIKNQNYGKEN
jgi:hypothetical protein